MTNNAVNAERTYSINMIDAETPPAWISVCETFRPASQDSGRCRFIVTTTTSKHDDLIDALEADDDVIDYSEIDE